MAKISDIAITIGTSEVSTEAGAVFTIDAGTTSANPRVIFSDVDFTMASGNNFGLFENADAIRGSVWNIVNTRLGERVMRPNFGINIRDFLFEPLSWDNIRLIQFHLMRAFSSWDPRISVLGVDILNSPTEQNALELLVNLKIKGLNKAIPLLIKGSTSQF